MFLPGEFHRLRSLVGYSPWGRKESNMTEQLHFTSLHACVSHCFSSHQKFTGVTPPSSLLKYEIQLSKFKDLTNFVQWFVAVTQWTWVWASSGSWWWTDKPGVLQSMGSQRGGHDWATELNWTELISPKLPFNRKTCNHFLKSRIFLDFFWKIQMPRQ